MSPEEMWRNLCSLIPGEDGPDVDWLRTAYKKNRDEAVRGNFEQAVRAWTDDEVKEFLCKWMFEPPVSTEFEQAAPAQRREWFLQIYRRVFES